MLKNNNGSIYASVDQTYGGTDPHLIPFCLKRSDNECAILGLLIFPSTYEGVSEALRPAFEALLHEKPMLGKDSVVVQETSNNEIIVKGSSGVKSSLKQSILSSSGQSKQEQVDNRLESQGAGNIPQYMNLEPSLAMDWLEIPWEDLRIKERVGAGKFSASPASLF